MMEMGEPIRSLFQSPVNLGPRLWAPTCLILILSTFVSGQSLEKPTLSLGEALVHPLEETRLSLQLSGVEGKAIVHLELRIQFSAVPLRFVRVERDEAKNSLSVHTKLETDPQDQGQQATLLLEVDSLESLSEGELLQLIFEATDEIYENEVLVIKIVEASLRTAGGEQVEGLNLEDGKVIISIPLFSCFFYMH
ncbi:MAG: hypothetical protein V3S50_13090 [Acidobacteriota bacterium]